MSFKSLTFVWILCLVFTSLVGHHFRSQVTSLSKEEKPTLRVLEQREASLDDEATPIILAHSERMTAEP